MAVATPRPSTQPSPSTRKAAASRPSRVAPSRCEQRAVGSAARKDYDKRYAKFVAWVAQSWGAIPDCAEMLELALLDLMDNMLDEDLPAHEAEKVVAAVKDGLPFASGPHSMPRVRRALAGYRKAKPARSRAPLCAELVAGICALLLRDGHRDLALQVFTCFCTYLRPGEARRLRVRELLAPMRRSGPLSSWSVVVAPQEESAFAPQRLSKTGTMDDTVLLDNYPWLGPTLAAHAKGRAVDAPLFTTSPGEAVKLFVAAAAALGLHDVCMYQLRHGGASEDMVGGSRSATEILARGRWRALSSLRRYAKPATLRRLLASVTPAVRAYCTHELAEIKLSLSGRRLPPPPP